jgi:hypothetical protein
MREKETALIPIWGLLEAHSVGDRSRVGFSFTPDEGGYSTSKWQRRTGPSFCGIGEVGRGREGEKGLQDKGSPSRGLLSVCLHILLSRDRASLARDRRVRNGDNLSFSKASCEHHLNPVASLAVDAAKAVAGEWGS